VERKNGNKYYVQGGGNKGMSFSSEQKRAYQIKEEGFKNFLGGKRKAKNLKRGRKKI